MTVGAQQHALGSLGPQHGQRQRRAGVVDRQALLTGIEMVKLKRADVRVVSARDAPATRLRHERLLDAAAMLRDPLLAAALTSVVTATLDDEIRVAMDRTVPKDRQQPL